MGSEVQTLNERIAERIGKDLVELIPEDQWQKMVDGEVAKFYQVNAPKIINELLTEAYMNKVKAVIDNLTNSTEWDQETQEQVHVVLEKFIGKSAGSLMGAMLAPSMSMALQDFRQRLGY